ncbi:unnamed protein product [Prunus armeniaca]
MLLAPSGFAVGVRGTTSLNGAWDPEATWRFDHSIFGRLSHGPRPRPIIRTNNCGRLDPSRPKQLDRCFVTAIRSEQSDRFTITYVVIAVRLPSSLLFGRFNYNPYKPRSNLRRISGTTQLSCNGRTPRSSGPAGKAAERGATSSTASRSPARSTPSGSSDRRRLEHYQGRLSPETAEGTELY